MSIRALRLAFVPLSLLAASAALAASLTGSGRSVSEDRALSGYRGIALSIPGRVEIVQGAVEGIRITADDNVMPEIESVVENGTLKLRFRQRFGNVDKVRILVVVHAKTVESLAVAGSGDIHAPALNAQRLSVHIAGSGDVKLAGRAESIDVSIAGSGDLDAGRFDTQRAKISVAGAGDATVWARQALKVSVAGSGGIRYYGDPTVERSIVGSGSVKRLGAAPT
jgi:hypothetical protein